MSTTPEFVKKVADIQAKLKAPKNQRNTFGNYNYRNKEDILEAVKPLLNGLTLTVSDDVVMVGNRIYVKATAMITDGTSSMATTAFAKEPETQKGMSDPQLTGATSSYAGKYALNGLFLIDDTKDPDTDSYSVATKSTPAPTEAVKSPGSSAPGKKVTFNKRSTPEVGDDI